MLATAALLGLEGLYTLGGAQAVGWMVFGEPGVDLVAGPGNRFMAEAKRQLAGRCGIDSVAGPSEVLVIADGGADPATVAGDLLAQAERDPDTAAVPVSADPGLLEAVAADLASPVPASPPRTILESSLGRHGRLIQAGRELATAFAQAWAPEHLELSVVDPEAWLPGLTTAGALFMGETSAEVFGDSAPAQPRPAHRRLRPVLQPPGGGHLHEATDGPGTGPGPGRHPGAAGGPPGRGRGPGPPCPKRPAPGAPASFLVPYGMFRCGGL